MPQSKNRLELNKPEFGTRALNFFNLMSVPEFQKSFFSDPAGVALRELNISVPGKTSISKTNNQIFKLLSDKNFNRFAEEFQIFLLVSDERPQMALFVRRLDLSEEVRLFESRQKHVGMLPQITVQRSGAAIRGTHDKEVRPDHSVCLQ